MAKNISIFRITGNKDPKEQEDSQISDDIDGGSQVFNDNIDIFMKQIPKEDKQAGIVTLLKIFGASDRSRQLRREIVSGWRLRGLKANYERLLERARVLRVLDKLAGQKRKAFYRFLLRLRDRQWEKKMEDLKNQKEQQLNEFTDNMKNLTLKQQGGVEIGKDVFDRFKDYEKQITDLKSTVKLNNTKLQKLRDQNVKNSENKQARVELVRLRRENKVLGSENETQKLLLEQLQLAKLENAEKIKQMQAQLDVFERNNQLKNLSKFSKIRFLLKVQKSIELKLKTSAFIRLNQNAKRARRAMEQVAERLRARLLLVTRERNCGADLRKTFLKWLVKSHPQLLYSSIKKLAITAKLREQVAIWRLRSLIDKPIEKKVSEAVKAIKRLKGFQQLQRLVERRRVREGVHLLNQLNPHHQNAEQQKIKTLLVDVFRERMLAELKRAVGKFRANLRFQRQTLAKLKFAQRVKQQQAVQKLKERSQKVLQF